MATNEMTKTAKNEMAAPPAQKEARITNMVADEIAKLSEAGRIQFPANYSVSNALAAAWLALQEVKAGNGNDAKPIIQNGQPTGIVTTRSMVNALHSMVVQGLNPAKKQVYFIVRGDQLCADRSYFGDVALAERAMPGLKLYYDTINEGDTFTTTKVMTAAGFVTVIKSHDIPFPRGTEILGAYCGGVRNGEPLGVDVFDMNRIKQSWTKSKTAFNYNDKTPIEDRQLNPISTHAQFTGDMCLRTVIRHYCKMIINSSDDSMLKEAVNKADNDRVEFEVAADVEANANRTVIDATYHGEDGDTEIDAVRTGRADDETETKEEAF